MKDEIYSWWREDQEGDMKTPQIQINTQEWVKGCFLLLRRVEPDLDCKIDYMWQMNQLLGEGTLVCWKSSIRTWVISPDSSTGFPARNWGLDYNAYKVLAVILWLCLHSTADPVSMSLPYAIISRSSGIAGSGSNHVVAPPSPTATKEVGIQSFLFLLPAVFYFPPGLRYGDCATLDKL